MGLKEGAAADDSWKPEIGSTVLLAMASFYGPPRHGLRLAAASAYEGAAGGRHVVPRHGLCLAAACASDGAGGGRDAVGGGRRA